MGMGKVIAGGLIGDDACIHLWFTHFFRPDALSLLILDILSLLPSVRFDRSDAPFAVFRADPCNVTSSQFPSDPRVKHIVKAYCRNIRLQDREGPRTTV